MSEVKTAEQQTNSAFKAADRPIIVKGARVHNLKNIDVEIPRNKMTVITGVSGSGKSSLAFDTIYAEGQRRYVESLSSYARQFLERMDKPDVDFMQGISPAMAIQQKTTSTNPRSTVGTTTEIYDYMRLLYARIGHTISPKSGQEVEKDSTKIVIKTLFNDFKEGTKFYVLFPIPEHEGNDFDDELQVLKEKGFTRLLKVDDEQTLDMTTDEVDASSINRHDYRVLVDRLVVKKDDDTRQRIAGSLETAFHEGRGRCSLKIRNNDLDKVFASSEGDRGGSEQTSKFWKDRIIPYNSNLKQLARNLRNNSTKSEIKLWEQLKGKKMHGYDFDRQKPVDEYICDFFCRELMLAIELDGITHDHEEVQVNDEKREKRLNEIGINVLRFLDDEGLNETEHVLNAIEAYVKAWQSGNVSVLEAEDNTPLNPLSRGDFIFPEDKNMSPPGRGVRGGSDSKSARAIIDEHGEMNFSERFEMDGIEFEEPSPQMFSFNNPYGACNTCEGFGQVAGIDEDLVVPDPEKSIRAGAIAAFSGQKYSRNLRDLIKVAARYSLPIDTPYSELSKEFKKILWQGKDEYIGIRPFFEDIKSESYKVHKRVFYSRYRGYSRCPDCEGYRVRKDALYVKVNGKHIGELGEMTIGHGRDFFENLELTDFEKEVAEQILYEIRKRLKYLDEVGLEYLTLNRLAKTLSGGESQRISLANSLGSSLIGSLYVLDEPTIGLHPRDNNRLINILKSLRDIGNTVLVVEHDPEMIKAADNIIDIGPFAGVHGGEVNFTGSYGDLLGSKTLTGKYLSGRKEIPVPEKRRKGDGNSITLEGATEHNLKSLEVDFPLGKFICVTGVSGSGKSTLVHDTLFGSIQKQLGTYKDKVGRHRNISGLHHIDSVEMVDQSPIGRSSRSNPATYTKAFDGIRDLFSDTRQSKIMGYEPGHFSFNVPGGRCEACQGEGIQTIEMQFMADIELVCEECNGKRYRKDVLQVKYRGQNIHDVLEMSVSEALEFFVDEDRITNKLQTMEDVGLGYLKLGQSATTLSGGEAQRVKLAKFLSKSAGDHTLYFFDEPTTGLHFEDIAKLLDSFNELVDNGHSVIIIEHNLDVIKCADHVIDIGPEGGFAGGQIVGEGTPEEITQIEESYTGKYLKDVL
jgi:excinuclease ABC subunit A